MSRTQIALLALVLSLAAAIGGFFYGLHQGVVDESARRDGKAVQDLTSLINAHMGLIGQSKAASADMRRALGARVSADAITTRDLQDALKATADSRAGCVFDAGVMRQLGTARDRAAQAATSGIRGALPAASGGATDR